MQGKNLQDSIFGPNKVYVSVFYFTQAPFHFDASAV